MNEIKKQVLGRGLSALLESSGEHGNGDDSSLSLPLEAILPNPEQPRLHFSEEELLALSSSIKEKGVLQPILVRIHPQDREKYEIVAGERRWRASKQAGLTHIPALVRQFSDAEVLEVALLENIQRQDLNPIEEADGYRRLAQDFNHTQESLSRILGKSRSHIANTLRLLTLPKKVRDYLVEGRLSAGHGRTLVGAEDPETLAEIILKKNLNVRQAEILSKQKLKKNEDKELPSFGHSNSEKDVLKKLLSTLLDKPVDLILNGAGGKVIISFKNPTELDQLIQKFNLLI